MFQPVKALPITPKNPYGAHPQFVQIKTIKQPSFNTEVLEPLKASQLAAAQAEQAAAEQKQLALAAQEAAQALAASAPVVYTSPAPTLPTPSPEPSNNAKKFIYAMESGNNPGAINRSSGACGLGQALPCSKLPCSLTDYVCQDAWFTNYAISRYGSWTLAYEFWLVHHWW